LSSFYRTVCLILLFSQYLSKVNLPLIAYKDKKWKVFQYPLFKLFSVSVFLIIIMSLLNNYVGIAIMGLEGLRPVEKMLLHCYLNCHYKCIIA